MFIHYYNFHCGRLVISLFYFNTQAAKDKGSPLVPDPQDDIALEAAKKSSGFISRMLTFKARLEEIKVNHVCIARIMCYIEPQLKPQILYSCVQYCSGLLTVTVQ